MSFPTRPREFHGRTSAPQVAVSASRWATDAQLKEQEASAAGSPSAGREQCEPSRFINSPRFPDRGRNEVWLALISRLRGARDASIRFSHANALREDLSLSRSSRLRVIHSGLRR